MVATLTRAGDPGKGPVGPALTACVVEDQVVFREWLVALLARNDVVVTAAVGTVAEAEQVISQLEPDVAIIDNGLPDGRGIDLCSVLARTTPGTVVRWTAMVGPG